MLDTKGRILLLRDSRVTFGQAKKNGFKIATTKPSLSSTKARLNQILKILKAPPSARIVSQKEITKTLDSDNSGYFGFKVETADKKYFLSASFDRKSGLLRTLMQFFRN